MKNCFLIVLILMAGLAADACRAKRIVSLQYADSVWNTIKYRSGKDFIRSDTAFLMVSNRHITSRHIAFADEQTDTSQKHILYIVQKNDSTYVYELSSLQEGIALLPKKNWVLYTEGMGKTFTGNIKRASLMTTTYHVNVIFFDYASTNSTLGGRKNYNFSRDNSLNSYRQYTRFLKEIQSIRYNTQLLNNVSISIFLHSMGNLMFRRMMISGEFTAFEHKKFIDNIILNAACVNRKNHHRWIHKIDFANAVYVNYNKADAKLGGAMFISGNRKLGSKPKAPFERHIHYTDFHEAVGKNHSYFLNIPGRTFVMSDAIKNYYHRILNGENIISAKEFKPSAIVGCKMN